MSPVEDTVPEVKSGHVSPPNAPADDVLVDPGGRTRDASDAAPIRGNFILEVDEKATVEWRAMQRRNGGIPVVSNYFLGQEDRVMLPRRSMQSAYGIGDYIYVDGDFRTFTSFNNDTGIITLGDGNTLLLDGEPLFELFMAILGTPWDETYRARWMNDEDRTDYVPCIYVTRADFVSRTGEFYHPYIAR